jgi:Flp pilus assembly pilin Flp
MATKPKITATQRETTRLTPSGEENIMELFMKFALDEAGASAVEYALLLTFIALAIITSVTTFGQAVKGLFDSFKLPG